jgi:hypothetical protein
MSLVGLVSILNFKTLFLNLINFFKPYKLFEK